MCREITWGLLIAEHRSGLAAVECLFWHGGGGWTVERKGLEMEVRNWIKLERDGFAIDSAGSESH